MVSEGDEMISKAVESSLNPCSNGRWSLRSSPLAISISGGSLNPCSNGRWSLSISSPMTGTRSRES